MLMPAPQDHDLAVQQRGVRYAAALPGLERREEFLREPPLDGLSRDTDQEREGERCDRNDGPRFTPTARSHQVSLAYARYQSLEKTLHGS